MKARLQQEGKRLDLTVQKTEKGKKRRYSLHRTFPSFSCLFVCKQRLKGGPLVYPLAVQSTPRTGSSSPKGAVRSSRLPSICRRAFITSLHKETQHSVSAHWQQAFV